MSAERWGESGGGLEGEPWELESTERICPGSDFTRTNRRAAVIIQLV